MCIVHYILHDCDLLKLGKHTHSTCEQNIPVWEREARISRQNIHKVTRNQTVLIHTVHFNFMQVSSLREKEQADSSAPKRVAETSIMAAPSTSKKSRYCCS